MAILYVRDKETRKIIALVEDFLSLVWTERYQEAGDFVLDMPVTKEYIDLFRKGRYISLDDSEETMIIQTVDITESFGDEEEPNLEISGKSLTELLSRRANVSRVIDYQQGVLTYSGKYSEVIQNIVNNDIISPIKSYWSWYHKVINEDTGAVSWVIGYEHYDSNPSDNLKISPAYNSDPSRAIKNFVFKNNLSSSLDVDISESYGKLMTLYDLIQSLSKRHLMGFRVVMNSDNNFEFQVYSGVDRTSSQKVLDPVIFDPSMDNISYVNYFDDSSNYKNCWLTYGKGYLCPRRPMGTNDWNSGELESIDSGYYWGYETSDTVTKESITDIDRIEIPFSTDEVDDYSTLNTIKKVSEARHDMQVDGRDQFEDGEYTVITSSEGSIDPLVRYRYGTDYFIGDRVDITNNNGIVMTAIISEVVRSYDSDGITVTPNFMDMTKYDYGYDEDDNPDDENSEEV